LRSGQNAKTDSVDAAWTAIMQNYGDEALHDQFVAVCFENQSLERAAERYMRLVLAMPNDGLAQRMLGKVQAMAVLPLARVGVEESPIRFGRYIIYMICLFAGFAFVVGYFIPGARAAQQIAFVCGLLGLTILWTLDPRVRYFVSKFFR
jgi:hypothetical protein